MASAIKKNPQRQYKNFVHTRKHCKSTSQYQQQPQTISMQTFCCPLTCKSLCKVIHSDLLYQHYKLQNTKKCQTKILLQEVKSVICYLSEQTSRCYLYLVKSYEAHFELYGCVIKNMCYWNKANPYEMHLKTLHYQTVTIWCRIMVVSITGPYFFKEKLVLPLL